MTRYRKIDAPKQNNSVFINTIFKPGWHLTKEEAIERAEEMRIKEIETCFRKIKRLAKFNFKINID